MPSPLLTLLIPAEWESYLLDVVRRAMAELDKQPEWARDRHKAGTLRLTIEREAGVQIEDAAA